MIWLRCCSKCNMGGLAKQLLADLINIISSNLLTCKNHCCMYCRLGHKVCYHSHAPHSNIMQKICRNARTAQDKGVLHAKKRIWAFKTRTLQRVMQRLCWTNWIAPIWPDQRHFTPLYGKTVASPSLVKQEVGFK